MDGKKKEDLLAIIKEKDGRIEELTRQMESRTELTRMIVHDLKGPLASIFANLDLLMSGKLDREKRDILETAIQGSSDLLNIINNLLEIGRMEKGKLELNLSVINLEGMLKASVEQLKSLSSQKNIALEIDCRSKIASVAADATLIERMMYNLIMNAIKYTREGGKITLITEDGRSKNTVLIKVSDTGIGIPKEFHETVFNLYTQVRLPGERGHDRQGRDSGATNKSASGIGRDKRKMTTVGIGLAFCKLAAEQHGGRIGVVSKVGKGSTFFISLPTNLIPSGSDLF